ncbi:hypothetical protein BC938DRAFT_484209 [Jimgerdemannia flammicorona]|uniref:Uncharacterized protein n=1 Tax=Jimgerdemannia flammicorona TaxID=994334 RepID=A0A433QVG9_9FUNG|nr:hypothetical protein BC938DRAFT_484209 [Jimgerdemannia flammicorona]
MSCRVLITHVVYSHSAVIYSDKVQHIAHVDTAFQLSEFNDPNHSLPHRVFKDQHTVRVEWSYNGPIHTPGNVFIYAHEHGILVVDLIFLSLGAATIRGYP